MGTKELPVNTWENKVTCVTYLKKYFYGHKEKNLFILLCGLLRMGAEQNMSFVGKGDIYKFLMNF